MDIHQTIILRSSDNELFETDFESIECSKTITTMLQHCAIDPNDDTILVPVPVISSETLSRVLEWCKRHRDLRKISKPIDDTIDEPTENIPEWDIEFLNIPQSALFDLILAANYLDIPLLLEYGCKTVANMIKGKTSEEIRKTFNIKNDFTAKEEERILRECEWDPHQPINHP